jgi:hypothetical protein
LHVFSDGLKETEFVLNARGRKGQILIFIVIILILAFVVFGLFSAFFGGGRPAPSVLEAYWSVGGRKDTTAVVVGERVVAVVVIKPSEQYVGSVVLKVRKDVQWWFDKDYAVATVPVDLRGGVEKELALEFVPDEASSGGVGSLKGYFIEVEFSAVGASWTMDSAYPPRLEVVKQG